MACHCESVTVRLPFAPVQFVPYKLYNCVHVVVDAPGHLREVGEPGSGFLASGLLDREKIELADTILFSPLLYYGRMVIIHVPAAYRRTRWLAR